MSEWTEIREAADVTEAHIENALTMRRGDYGGIRLDWHEVIYRLESSDEGWGGQMDSPAIKHLQRQVNKRLREENQ